MDCMLQIGWDMRREGTMKSTVIFFWIIALILQYRPAYADNKIYIGLDAAFGNITSTSETAIKQGILIAIDEINRTGGVLGGRKLGLIERDNRSVPARGIKNIREFAAMPNVVAVFCGKFSPVVQEEIPHVHNLGLPLLDPWAAADDIIDNGHSPNYVFRLSLKDSWAISKMLDSAQKKEKRRIGVIVPITGWGRSSNDAVSRYAAGHPDLKIVGTEWYSWGEASLKDKYLALLKSGAQAILLVANEREGSVLVREVASLPEKKRLPIFSHWGVSGGDFVKLTGRSIEKVDFSVVQTYSFIDMDSEKVRQVVSAAKRLFNIPDARHIKAPVGMAHAYDLTHILALAINLAGSADRKSVRDALERVSHYDGLIKSYDRPFSDIRHEALGPEDVFMARFMKDGSIAAAKED